MPATVALGDPVVADRARGRGSVSGPRISIERGPWTATRPVARERSSRTAREAVEPLGQRVRDDPRVRRVGDDHEPVLGEAVDDQVVDDPAVRGADHRVVGTPDGERRRIGDQRRRQGLRRPRGPRRRARPCATGRTGPRPTARRDAPRGSRRTGSASASRRTRRSSRPGPRGGRAAGEGSGAVVSVIVGGPPGRPPGTTPSVAAAGGSGDRVPAPSRT